MGHTTDTHNNKNKKDSPQEKEAFFKPNYLNYRATARSFW